MVINRNVGWPNLNLDGALTKSGNIHEIPHIPLNPENNKKDIAPQLPANRHYHRRKIRLCMELTQADSCLLHIYLSFVQNMGEIAFLTRWIPDVIILLIFKYFYSFPAKKVSKIGKIWHIRTANIWNTYWIIITLTASNQPNDNIWKERKTSFAHWCWCLQHPHRLPMQMRMKKNKNTSK